MAQIQVEVEVDLEGFFFPDLINELEHLIHNKEKGELDDYDCYLLDHLILAIQRRPEFKKYKNSTKKTSGVLTSQGLH